MSAKGPAVRPLVHVHQYEDVATIFCGVRPFYGGPNKELMMGYKHIQLFSICMWQGTNTCDTHTFGGVRTLPTEDTPIYIYRSWKEIK